MAVRPRRWVLISACWIAGMSLILHRPAHAQDPAPLAGAPSEVGVAPAVDRPATPAPRPGVDRSSGGRLLLQAHPMPRPPVGCSIVTMGYVLERWLALRRDRVIPREFADRFLERLSAGKLDRERALELCRAHDSPAARVFAIVVGAWGQPGATIRQILSYDAAGEVVEL